MYSIHLFLSGHWLIILIEFFFPNYIFTIHKIQMKGIKLQNPPTIDLFVLYFICICAFICFVFVFPRQCECFCTLIHKFIITEYYLMGSELPINIMMVEFDALESPLVERAWSYYSILQKLINLTHTEQKYSYKI